MLGAPARGDSLGEAGARGPVRLEIASCLAAELDAIQRAVRVEIKQDATAEDATAVAVRVDCAVGGLEAGVVLDVRHPGSARHYRYALDWRAQPGDARPRLIGLAVAEAVDASRIELVAVPEPALADPRAGRTPAITAPPTWSLALVALRRSFTGSAGVEVLGVGLMPARRVSPRVRLAADLVVEGTTVLASSGAVAVRSVSSAPRIAYRLGGRLHGELGLGLRVGVVHIQAESLPGSQLAGERLVRVWLGPAATLALGAELTHGLALTAALELGVVATGATARDLGEPVAALRGAWTSFGVAAAISL